MKEVAGKVDVPLGKKTRHVCLNEQRPLFCLGDQAASYCCCCVLAVSKIVGNSAYCWHWNQTEEAKRHY